MAEKQKKLGEEAGEERIKPEIPEQRMKRELAKIPDEDRELYKFILQRMGLPRKMHTKQPSPQDILEVDKLHRLAKEMQLMCYTADFTLQRLGTKGVINNSEDLKEFVDGLEEKLFKPCEKSYRNRISSFNLDGISLSAKRDSISTAFDGALSAIWEMKPETIKTTQRAVDYAVELYKLVEPIAREGLKVDKLLEYTVPALEKAGVMGNPDEIGVFREELSGLAKRAGDKYSRLFEKNFPEIVKRFVKKDEDVATLADGLSTPRIIECAEMLQPRNFRHFEEFDLNTPESFGEKVIDVYIKTRYERRHNPNAKKLRSLLSDERLSELHVSDMMTFIALMEGFRFLNIANLEANPGNILAMHKVYSVYSDRDSFAQLTEFRSLLVTGIAKTQDEMEFLAEISERYPHKRAERLFNELCILKGVMEPDENLRSCLEPILKLEKLLGKMKVNPDMASTYIAHIVLLDKKVGSLQEFNKRVDDVRKFSEVDSWKDVDVYPLLGVLPILEDAGLLKPPGNSAMIFRDLANNPHVVEYLEHVPTDDLSRLKPQNFSSQVIELGANELARILDFQPEKMSALQKRQLSKMLGGLEFIEESEEVKALIKRGLEGTYRQLYDSLEENKNTLGQMQELGINTDVYVYHKGIDKVAFRIESGKILRMEPGAEHARSTLHSMVNQLFNNQAGEIFKNPAKVSADVAQDPEFPRKYRSRGERVEALLTLIQSKDEEWLKEALSVLERHLKTAGTNASSIVDSEQMQGEPRIALVHIQRAKALFGMKVRPLKGETGEIIISLNMCDKNPLVAITLGNDAGCCMGLSEQNNWAWPLYLKDMSIQIGEIFIKREGKESRVGPVWLFAGKINGEPALVIDSIDITSAYREMDEVYGAVIDYMKDFAEKAGFKRVVLGAYFNDADSYAKERVKKKEFTKEKLEIEKIHNFAGKFYMDVLHNNKPKEEVEVFVVK